MAKARLPSDYMAKARGMRGVKVWSHLCKQSWSPLSPTTRLSSDIYYIFRTPINLRQPKDQAKRWRLTELLRSEKDKESGSDTL